MATRFYFGTSGAGVPTQSPSFNAGWEDTGSGAIRRLVRKNNVNFQGVTGASTTNAVPNGTTGDYAIARYISDPIPAQIITGTVSLSMLCLESDANLNATLALVLSVISNDGSVNRGTLFSVFGTDTEVPITTQATRIVNAQSLTQRTAQEGDRLVAEIGCHVAASSATNATYSMYTGLLVDTADFALTSGLTTALNGWLEVSKDLYPAFASNNHQFIEAGDGISVSERIR